MGLANVGELDRSEVFHAKGIALQGYDVVSYFRERRAVRGNQAYCFHFKGLDWWFSSGRNQKDFAASPEIYLPQYGGYCAFGASEGYKARTQPHVFELYEGKLYFNFAGYVQKRWREKMEEKVAAADERWPDTKHTQPIAAHPVPIWWKYQFLKLFGRDLFQ